MAWTFTSRTEDFLDRAGEHLRARPAEHSVELAAAQRLLDAGPGAYGQPPLLGLWRGGGGRVTATAFHTPPYPMLLSGESGTAARLAAELASRSWPVTGVTAGAAPATAFAARWQELTAASSSLARRIRLYQLGQLTVPPREASGSARLAGAADAAVLTRWIADFGLELGEPSPDPAAEVADRLSYGGLTLWEDDGMPVAMAGYHRPVAGVTRIAPVYTVPGARGRGYGGAVTVAVTRAGLSLATIVVLSTDAANPVSNALYTRLGYQLIGNLVTLQFGPATCS